MSRVVLEEGKQKEILESIHSKSKLAWRRLADSCNISPRSFFDWRREKYKNFIAIRNS